MMMTMAGMGLMAGAAAMVGYMAGVATGWTSAVRVAKIERGAVERITQSHMEYEAVTAKTIALLKLQIEEMKGRQDEDWRS